MLLGLALLEWLERAAPKDSIWHTRYAQLAFTPLLVLALYYGRKFIRRHVTYARTGLVECRKTTMSRLAPAMAFVIAAVAAVGAALLLRRGGVATQALLVWAGNVLFYAVVTRMDPAWKRGSVLAMTLGLLAITLGAADRKVLDHAYLVFFGIIWIASGGVTFGLYLRHTQPPEQAAE